MSLRLAAVANTRKEDGDGANRHLHRGQLRHLEANSGLQHHKPLPRILSSISFCRIQSQLLILVVSIIGCRGANGVDGLDGGGLRLAGVFHVGPHWLVGLLAC